MYFIQIYGKEIVALLVPLFTWALSRCSGSGVKLQRGIRHSHTFLVNQPLVDGQGVQLMSTQTANTASVVVLNRGRATATNVEFVFNFSPMCINFWPLRSYVDHVQADGRHVYIFPSLAPNEMIGFELLSVNQSLPALVNLRCDQMAASEVRLSQYVTVAPWKIQLLRFLALLGLGAAVYLLIQLVQFLVLSTPPVV